jgi:MFS transporter, DHA1 family, multidrug resistance protein
VLCYFYGAVGKHLLHQLHCVIDTMHDLIRDSALGQVIRFVTRNKYLRYIEESESFQHPYYSIQSRSSDLVAPPEAGSDTSSDTSVSLSETASKTEADDYNNSQFNATDASPPDLSQTVTRLDDSEDGVREPNPIERLITQQSLHTVEQTRSQIIKPTRTTDGVILVDWYTTGASDGTDF